MKEFNLAILILLVDLEFIDKERQTLFKERDGIYGKKFEKIY
jgi:hypothetical protein